MRVEELSIGDWVFDKDKNTYRQVETEDFYFGRTLYFEPVPITPEILERNGFELKPDGWLWSNEGLEDQNYIFIQFRKGCEGVRNCEINFIHRAQFTFKQMYFVHDLQHAMRLCGITKTIEL